MISASSFANCQELMPFNDFVAISFYPFFIGAAPEAAFQWEFQFVVLFIHQDYDRLWDTIKANAPEFFIAWRDCGHLDERGGPKPSYAVWRQYFERPLEQPGSKAKP